MTVLNLLNCLIVTYGVPFAVYRGTKLADYSAFGTVLWGGLAWFVATICQVFRIRSDGRVVGYGCRVVGCLGVCCDCDRASMVRAVDHNRLPSAFTCIDPDGVSSNVPVRGGAGGPGWWWRRSGSYGCGGGGQLFDLWRGGKGTRARTVVGMGVTDSDVVPLQYALLTFCSRSVPFSFPF